MRLEVIATRALASIVILLAAGPALSAAGGDRNSIDQGSSLADRIVGTWELVSYKVQDKGTGKLIDAMGSAPRGRIIFTKDGWVAFNLEGSGRMPAHSDTERATLMKTLVSYIGKYRVEGDQWVTSVQTAWAPEWVGTEQRRNIKLEGEYADVTTPWRVMPNWDDGRTSRSVIRFKHIQ